MYAFVKEKNTYFPKFFWLQHPSAQRYDMVFASPSLGVEWNPQRRAIKIQAAYGARSARVKTITIWAVGVLMIGEEAGGVRVQALDPLHSDHFNFSKLPVLCWRRRFCKKQQKREALSPLLIQFPLWCSILFLSLGSILIRLMQTISHFPMLVNLDGNTRWRDSSQFLVEAQINYKKSRSELIEKYNKIRNQQKLN